MYSSFQAMFDVSHKRFLDNECKIAEQKKMKEKMKAKEIIEDELKDEEIDFS